MLKKEGLLARFALVGEIDPDNPASIPASQVNSWEDEGVIESWGWRTVMVEVYRQAQIVCLPSYREGLSKTLIEAAACGRPIITSDVPGCREVIQPGISGLLVPPRDPAALAQAIRYLLQNPDERRSMGTKGRIIAENEFSMKTVISQTLSFYEHLQGFHRDANL
jgi:glycosyltransferase involved in cell wall biosynthesis